MTPPLRLAYLCSDPGIAPDATKGAAVHFREMAHALRQQGAELDVFMARRGSTADDSVTVIEAPATASQEPEARALAASDAITAALEAGGGEYDAIYERLSLFGIAGMAHATKKGIPLILEVNAPLWSEAARYRSLQHEAAAKSVALDAMFAAHRILVVSEELQRILIEAGVASDKIEVMHNGVNRELFESAGPVKRPKALDDKPILVFVGSLKPWHGIDFLLHAFAHCCHDLDLGLWVVGDGPLRADVEAAALSEAIHYQGAVDHHEIPGILKAADVAVAPYSADAPTYFCPLKVVEALAAGCPLLASKTEPVLEAVAQHPGVVLFTPGDLDDFRRALGILLANKRPRHAAVPDAMTWDSKARRVLQLVRSGVQA